MLFGKSKRRSKGFTLAELLVVVAIIAILVAVSIPIFTGRMEKSRESVDIANMRAARAAATSDYLGKEYTDASAWTLLTSNENYKEYRAVYDAERGRLAQSADGIEPYGKGTVSDGKSSYGEYESNEDYTNRLICVTIRVYEDSDDKNLFIIDWYNAF